jgi:adenosylhomocysteine nucleosidase
MTTLVVTPMQEELTGLLDECKRQGFEINEGGAGRLPIAHIPKLGLIVACGGTGKVQFGIQTQHLLDNIPDVNLVICAGAAGALADNLSVGDVVVATSTIEHDVKERFIVKTLPEFEGQPEAIAGLKQATVSDIDTFHVHFGAIASGDEDIVDEDRRSNLEQETSALAVAWEGAGGARACAFNQVGYVEVRGVTDVANTQASSDFEQNLAMVMANISMLLILWVSQG